MEHESGGQGRGSMGETLPAVNHLVKMLVSFEARIWPRFVTVTRRKKAIRSWLISKSGIRPMSAKMNTLLPRIVASHCPKTRDEILTRIHTTCIPNTALDPTDFQTQAGTREGVDMKNHFSLGMQTNNLVFLKYN